MGTEVLRPQDCLARRAPDLFHRQRISPAPNPNPNPNPSCKLSRKAPSPEGRRRRDASAKPQQKQLVMGRVTILKRGEPIEEVAERTEERGENLVWDGVMMFGTGRLGPEPAMMPKQIRVAPCRSDACVGEDGYAGSAFSMSPSPRFLPLPSFSRGESCAAAFDRSATVGLRRLLRLE